MSRKKFFIISLCVVIPIVAAVVVICIYPYISKKNEPTSGQVTPSAPDNILWEPTLLTSQTQIVNNEITFTKPLTPAYGDYVFKAQGTSGKLIVGPYSSQEYLFGFKDSVNLFTVIDFNNEYVARNYTLEMVVTTCDSLGKNKQEVSVIASGSMFEGFIGTLTSNNTSWNYVYSVLTRFNYL